MLQLWQKGGEDTEKAKAGASHDAYTHTDAGNDSAVFSIGSHIAHFDRIDQGNRRFVAANAPCCDAVRYNLLMAIRFMCWAYPTVFSRRALWHATDLSQRYMDGIGACNVRRCNWCDVFPPQKTCKSLSLSLPDIFYDSRANRMGHCQGDFARSGKQAVWLSRVFGGRILGCNSGNFTSIYTDPPHCRMSSPMEQQKIVIFIIYNNLKK